MNILACFYINIMIRMKEREGYGCDMFFPTTRFDGSSNDCKMVQFQFLIAKMTWLIVSGWFVNCVGHWNEKGSGRFLLSPPVAFFIVGHSFSYFDLYELLRFVHEQLFFIRYRFLSLGCCLSFIMVYIGALLIFELILINYFISQKPKDVM